MARCFPASMWMSCTLVPAYTLVKGVAGTNEPDALPMFTIVPLRFAFMAGKAMRVICSSRVTGKADFPKCHNSASQQKLWCCLTVLFARRDDCAMKLLSLNAYLINAGDIDLHHISNILVREVLKVLTMIVRQPYVVDQQADIKGR